MSSTITVRDIDPGDEAWLEREARQRQRRSKPSELFERHVGPGTESIYHAQSGA